MYHLYSGILMSAIAGCFYGLNFTPVVYIQDNYKIDGKPVSQNGESTQYLFIVLYYFICMPYIN